MDEQVVPGKRERVKELYVYRKNKVLTSNKGRTRKEILEKITNSEIGG